MLEDINILNNGQLSVADDPALLPKSLFLWTLLYPVLQNIEKNI
jgi:hypothetical protein